MNIGKVVTLAFIAFAAFIGFFAVQAFTHKSRDLVDDNYYENELAFDSQKEEIRNYRSLQDEVNLSLQQPGVVITFPESISEVKSGNIKFYRPDEKKYDREFALELNENHQQILSYDDFYNGLYEVSIHWEGTEKSYLFKKDLIIE